MALAGTLFAIKGDPFRPLSGVGALDRVPPTLRSRKGSIPPQASGELKHCETLAHLSNCPIGIRQVYEKCEEAFLSLRPPVECRHCTEDRLEIFTSLRCALGERGWGRQMGGYHELTLDAMHG